MNDIIILKRMVANCLLEWSNGGDGSQDDMKLVLTEAQMGYATRLAERMVGGLLYMVSGAGATESADIIARRLRQKDDGQQ